MIAKNKGMPHWGSSCAGEVGGGMLSCTRVQLSLMRLCRGSKRFRPGGQARYDEMTRTYPAVCGSSDAALLLLMLLENFQPLRGHDGALVKRPGFGCGVACARLHSARL